MPKNWDWHDERSDLYGYNDDERGTTDWHEKDGSYDSTSPILDKDNADYYADVHDTYINEDRR